MSDEIENENVNVRFYHRIDGSAFTLSDLLYKSIIISSSLRCLRNVLKDEIESGCKSEKTFNRILKEMLNVDAEMQSLSQELEDMYRDNNALYLFRKINS